MSGQKRRFPYEKVVERFANSSCELLTTKQEYEEKDMNACSKFLVKMPCEHERSIYYRNITENPGMKCKDCTRKQSQAEIYYIRMEKRFTDYNCKLLTTIENFIKNDMNVTSIFEYEASCGHYNSGVIHSFVKNKDALCKDCMKKVRYDKVRLPYQEVKERFEKNGCRLLTTIKEYYDNRMTIYDRYKFVAVCGHERSCSMATWKGRVITLCTECVRLELSEKMKLINEVGEARGNIIEHAGFVFIRSLLNTRFVVKKLREGTLADFLIKPKTVESDDWLRVQLKVTLTETENRGYRFTFRKSDYTGMALLCICLEEEKMWLFDGSVSKHICGICITKGSKYNAGNVATEDIASEFEKYYNNSYLFRHLSYDEANVPVSPSHQVEYLHQQLRENMLGHLFYFDYPELEGQVFDFRLDGYKIQEKTGTLVHNATIESCYIQLKKHGGSDKKVAYANGDNDFYWVSCPDKDTFYVFSESILIEKGYVSLNKAPTKLTTLTLHWTTNDETCADAWTFPYRFKYSTLDKFKLKALFFRSGRGWQGLPRANCRS